MIKNPLLRDAVAADLPVIVAIYNASIPGQQATADTEPVTLASRQAWFETHGPETYPLWVLTDSPGQILGWLGFQPFYGRPAYRSTAELSLYLAPAHQGQGLGKLLLKQALVVSPGLGLTTLVGYIFAHNQPSLRLFQSYDFQQWGYLPQVAELGGQKRDLMILGRQVFT
ncbi:N-acetyltransferase family protein [Synechocystis sp. LKSZ1]|uniref:GNAT family N-acetyltransferase n=1 Tax=Synechocystis sp. LKSZ1 TaxID=3144951 RepID=UPI00336C2D30